MKVLHYSDKSSPEFQQLYKQSDILISTGDLTLFDFPNLEDESNKIPAFGVYGNHDSGLYMGQLNIINVNRKVIEWNGLKIGGFQGCLRYKNSGIMFDENEAKQFADNFPYVDILLLHVGPKELLDEPKDEVHVGSENIRRYVDEKKPSYIFCGHQYSDDELVYETTHIFRTYGARIIEI